MSVDILGTNCEQCRSMVQCCFTSTETVRLIRTESPGRSPRFFFFTPIQPLRLYQGDWREGVSNGVLRPVSRYGYIRATGEKEEAGLVVEVDNHHNNQCVSNAPNPSVTMHVGC